MQTRAQSPIVACVLALLVGILAAGCRLVYSFFPYFLIVDFVFFGLVGFLISLYRPQRRWLWLALASAPVLLGIVRILVRLGGERLSEGVGIGHAYALLIIPVAVLVGSMMAQRVQRRAQEASS